MDNKLSCDSTVAAVHTDVKERTPNKSAWKWIPLVLALLFATNRLEVWNQTSQYPKAYEVQNYPLHEQPDGITCGPTSLKMLLEYYGKKHSVDEIKKQTKTELFTFRGEKIGGTAPDQMQKALDHFGVPSTLVHSNIHKLKKYVSEGRTPVALVRTGKALWHWVVVIGYDDKGHIITADPGGGEREVLKEETFVNAWKFTHDLYGRDMSSTCPICKGTGMWMNWLGPLGVCDMCGGDGKTIDIYWTLIELGEAQGCTLIVPKEKPNDVDTERSGTE